MVEDMVDLTDGGDFNVPDLTDLDESRSNTWAWQIHQHHGIVQNAERHIIRMWYMMHQSQNSKLSESESSTPGTSVNTHVSTSGISDTSLHSIGNQSAASSPKTNTTNTHKTKKSLRLLSKHFQSIRKKGRNIDALVETTKSDIKELIRKMPTLKPVHLALWNFTYFVASTKLIVIATQKCIEHIMKCWECT